jgi:hypothetical protein
MVYILTGRLDTPNEVIGVNIVAFNTVTKLSFLQMIKKKIISMNSIVLKYNVLDAVCVISFTSKRLINLLAAMLVLAIDFHISV